MSEVAKNSVINALRLSAASAEALDYEIERNINVARAELSRAGCADELAQSDNDLVISAIVSFCQMTMGNNERHERYLNAWIWQLENLRKSTITLDEEDDSSDDDNDDTNGNDTGGGSGE